MNQTSDIELAVIKTIQRLITQVDLLNTDEKKRLWTALTNFNVLLDRNIKETEDG